jgi:hypothetical protein
MKASSESGECANLISVALPGAGFVAMELGWFSLVKLSRLGRVHF